MKLKISVLILPAVAAALLLAGCVSEPAESGGIPDGKARSITFTFPDAGRTPATYVDATTGENDLDNLSIYMFDGDTSILEQVYTGSDIVVDKTTKPKPTATIDVTERSGDKEFFFVANGENITSKLGEARFGETTIAEFLESLCDKQSALPTTPLLMSGRSALSSIENVATADPTDLQIELSRRVARFDIDNDSTKTNFKITKILITNVSKQGYIFEDATGVPAQDIVKENASEIAFGTQPNANSDKIATSVFYTYPTTIGDDHTMISFEGIFRNDPGNIRLFTLKVASDVDIQANKRYILNVKPITINEVALVITVADWEHASEIVAEPGDNLISVTELELVTGNGVLSDTDLSKDVTYDVSKATNESILRFTTRSSWKSGAIVSVTYLAGDKTSLPIMVNDPAPVLTYGDACYVQDWEIKIPAGGLRNRHTEVLVDITNSYDRIQTITLKVYYEGIPHYQMPDGSYLPAVKVGGLWWAPVNCGATQLAGAGSYTRGPAYDGKLYQWGRSYYSCGYNESTATQQGPVTYEEGEKRYGDKFITMTGNIDWLDQPNDTLWSGDNRRGPCPEGWRVPVMAEFQKFIDLSNSSYITHTNSQLRVTSDDSGYFLWIQYTGERQANSTYASQGGASHYWSSEPNNPNTAKTVFFNHNSSNRGVPTANNRPRSFGLPIRCVQDI